MGCVLNFTNNDYHQLVETVELCRCSEGRLDKVRREEIRATLIKTTAPKLFSILDQPGTPAYKAVSELLAGAMVSKMTPAERELLPKAFATILKYNRDAMGLLAKAPVHRGPGSSAVQHHYEILSTAALIEHPQKYNTNTGKLLYIAPDDRVDFGIKFSKAYAEPRRFGTIEADMLIHRGTINPLSPAFGKTVAIDAKFSKAGKYSPKPDFQRQLDGIRTGLRDGKVHEFHFVTNNEFTGSFKEMINKTNLQIAKDAADHNRRLYSSIPRELLSEEELQNQSYEKAPPGFFPEVNDEFSEFVREFNIPQIELSEHVKYPGT